MMKISSSILILIIVFAQAFIFAFISGCINNETHEYKYLEKVGGINVYSDIPISEVENWDNVLLVHKNNTAIISCNLEISSVSQSNYKGPEIIVEESDKTGIYIHENSASIKGRNNADILRACHIFVCLKEGIICHEDLTKIQRIMSSDRLNIILSDDVKDAGVRGYTEVMMSLGYLQSANLNSGKASFIYPYLKENNTCRLQPFNNILQIINETVANETVNDCNISGIFIQKSDTNEIKIDGERIILSGDDEHLYSESVIVCDIIAPGLRLRMH